MTAKHIMTTNGSIAHKAFSSVSGGAFTIKPGQDDSNFKISGDNVYRGPLEYTFSGGNATGFVNGTVETINDVGIPVDNDIPPTASGISDIMRVGDEESMVCWGVPTSTPPAKAIVPFATVIVDAAGQDKVTLG